MTDSTAHDPQFDPAAVLAARIAAYNDITAHLKYLEASRKAMTPEIIALIFDTPTVDHVVLPTGTMRIRTKVTRTIKAERLIAQGISMAVIEAATVESVSEPFLQFYAKSEGEAQTE